MKQLYRNFIQGKTRVFVAWAFAGATIVCALHPADKLWVLSGALLAALGALLRFWASGYVRKNECLAVGGAYRMVRNPLYFGTFLMALGGSCMVGNLVLVIAATILFGAIYHFVILDEEVNLVTIFGRPYEEYCLLVPRFFPGMPIAIRKLVVVNADPEYYLFSWGLAMQNKAYEAPATCLGLFIAIALMRAVGQYLCNYGHCF